MRPLLKLPKWAPLMKKSDTVTVTSKSGRRRFIRAGSAFLLAGAATASAQEEGGFLRADCDSLGNAEGKNAEAANSDSDAGAIADRQGCGTKKKVPITYRGESKKYT